MEKIRIGIVGYGNIGRGVEQSIKRNDDMELKAVFTRRDPAGVSILLPICRSSDQKLLLLSTRSTVSIHTQESRNILQA